MSKKEGGGSGPPRPHSGSARVTARSMLLHC